MKLQGLNTIPELTRLGSFAAANQGPYRITGFRHLNCNGTIAVLPLYRNAEGAYILNRMLKTAEPGMADVETTELRSGVILAGEIYPQFPQLAFSLLQLKHRVSQLMIHPSSSPVPLAFAENGPCRIAEKIARTVL